MIPPRTREEILAVFADLAEEDPTVLRDLLLRVARWERQPPATRVAGPWHQTDSGAWVRMSVQIGVSTRLVSIVRPFPEASPEGWAVTANSTVLSRTRETAEEGRAAADALCRDQGWALIEDTPPAVEEPTGCTHFEGQPCAAWTLEGACRHVDRAHWRAEPALPSAPICTCTGPARDAHDPQCPVRIAHPRRTP
jgi:hypothetical protein